MAKVTIGERRFQLTEMVKQARADYHTIIQETDRKVRREHPDLPWYAQFDLREKDPKVIEASARLLALCDAANVMGADID